MEPDHLNLEQVTWVCGQSIDAVKEVIFKGDFLLPSYQFQRPIRANLYTIKSTPADNDDYPVSETVLLESNASVTGFVDIYSCSRHSGKFDGKIELHPNHRRTPAGLDSFLIRPRLYHWIKPDMRVGLELLEPCEISEDKLIVHRAEVERFIQNDHEAMERYEQFCASNVRIFTPKEVANILEIPEDRVFVISTPRMDQNTGMLKATLWPSAIFDKPVGLKRIQHTGKQVVDSHLAEYGGGQQLEVVYETLRGLFGVDASRGLQWDEDNRAEVDRLDRGEYTYTPVSKLTVRKSQIVFTRAQFEHYLEGVGDTTTILSKIELEQKKSNPLSDAATLMKRQQTAEIDKNVAAIMDKIHLVVQEASKTRCEYRVINHIRFIREAGLTEKQFDPIKKKVASQIKSKYGEVGFKSLSRRPKPDESYLLSK